MTLDRDSMPEAQPMLRNTPMRPREWRALLERDDIAAVEGSNGALVLAMADGQLNLHYAFAGAEGMRRDFGPMFEELRSEIGTFDAEYVRIGLVQLPERTWVEHLLLEADFREFGEWADMLQQELDPGAPPPDFPTEVVMRRGQPEDGERIAEIESEAMGELADGRAATLERLEDAAWCGVLERDGEPVGYAINDEVQRARGRILSLAVTPEAWGNGYGRLLLGAAAYQLTAGEARQATVRIRPDISQSVRTSLDLGFRADVRGVEFRRPADETVVEDRRHERRVAGVKARFGSWR